MVEVFEQQVGEKSLLANSIRNQIEKILASQRSLVGGLLMGLFTRGHILVEGVLGFAIELKRLDGFVVPWGLKCFHNTSPFVKVAGFVLPSLAGFGPALRLT